MDNTYILVCANSLCRNTRIAFDSEPTACDICGTPMSSVKLGKNPLGEKDLAAQELSLRSKSLAWVDDNVVEQWPGPLAFEYQRLCQIMLEGNIEGACWKIANLAEVTTSYFFCAALEKGLSHDLNKIPYIGIKLNLIKDKFSGQHFLRLHHDLDRVVKWRNTFGVGHGSLSRNKATHIESILELSKGLNISFGELTAILQQNGLTLQDEKGKELKGYNYVYEIPFNSWGQKLSCLPDKPATLRFPPLLLHGYHFSGPDVYFLDHKYYNKAIRTLTIKYKNYSQNRMKYLNFPYKGEPQVIWEEDLWQAAWLNPRERQAWFAYYRKKDNNKDARTCRKVLVDAAFNFQRRGMHDEARNCHRLYLKHGFQTNLDQELELKMILLEYIQAASRGDRDGATSYKTTLAEMLEAIKDKRLQKDLRIKTGIETSWHEGVYGDPETGINICRATLEKLQQIKEELPLTTALDELELLKNELYLSSRLPRGKDYQELIEKSKHLLYTGGKLYNFNPENDRIIDILGFACNLYGDFTVGLLESEDPPPVFPPSIYEFNRFGLKIRERFYKIYPDDIWAIRGYAWSLHCSGSLEKRQGQKNLARAGEFMARAAEIRMKGERKYPEDLGLKEDLAEHSIYLTGHLSATEQQVNQHKQEAEKRIRQIRDKEGNSPRVCNLREKLDEALKLNNPGAE